MMARRRTSAVQLGREIGKSQSYMSRRLTGETPFDIDDLEAIARALDVPVPQLLGTTRQKYAESVAAERVNGLGEPVTRVLAA